MIDLYKSIKKENITLNYVGNDSVMAVDTIEVILNAYKTLSKYHGLDKKNLSVRVIIAPTRKDYDRNLSEELKLKGKISSDKSEVARTHMNNILLLSTFAYRDESTVKYTREYYYTTLIDCMNKVFESFLSI